MAVRRLHPSQPASFAFTPENLAWAKETIAKYPDGKQASAVIPLLWRAQEQIGGWVTEPAIRAVADMLGMAYIRVYEIATFYTMFQLQPVGRAGHLQVCGTTPCMLSGSGALIEVCKSRIAEHAHEVSDDGAFSWEEVECLGGCANAPIVQIGKDTFEDLTPAHLEKILDTLARGKQPKPGSQTGRTASCPHGGATTLTDPALYDGSLAASWRKRFPELVGAAALTLPADVASASEKPPMHPGAAALVANAGLVPELEARGSGKPMAAGDIERLKPDGMRSGLSEAQSAVEATARTDATRHVERPELLTAARDGKADDLKLIWGVGPKLEEALNKLGIYHFSQIASWNLAQLKWVDDQLEDFRGRAVRDKWIEQARKLAAGWRPDGNVGEKPRG